MVYIDKYEQLKDDAYEDIINALYEGYSGYYCDLHNEVFNMEYAYIYYKDAVKDLEEFGVFDAIEKVKNYEQDNFGEVNTDFSNPCNVASMLYYIIGEEVISNLLNIKEFNDNWNNLATKETNDIILTAFANYGEDGAEC